MLSSEQRGDGESFDSPTGVTVGATQAYVVSNDSGDVVSLDLASGDRQLVLNGVDVFAPPDGRTAGGDSQSFTSIALDDSDNTFYVAVANADGFGNLIGIELFLLAEGDTMLTPLSLSARLKLAQIVDSDAGVAYIADTAADQLLKVILADGTTTALGPISGTPPPIASPYEPTKVFQDIALLGAESVLVDSSIAAVIAIDNETSVRREIPRGGVGNGTMFSKPAGIANDSTRNILLVVDLLANAVFAIEPVSGDRVVVSR